MFYICNYFETYDILLIRFIFLIKFRDLLFIYDPNFSDIFFNIKL